MSNIRFIHRRRIINGVIQNNGGSTIAFREVDNGTIEFATSKCSIRDNFSKELGRIKAAGRLNSTTHVRRLNETTESFISRMNQPELDPGLSITAK